MSSVRMCDMCGAIFSERQTGWGTFQGTEVIKVEGKRVTQSTQLDACPTCNPGMGEDRPEVTPTLIDRAPNFFTEAAKKLETEKKPNVENS